VLPVGDFTHLNEQGQARMVEVGDKDSTKRLAVAHGEITMSSSTLEKILAGTITKGEVFNVARLAGIMAAKKTAELIPLCPPLSITGVDLRFPPETANNKVEIEASVRITGRTGVEMEALTAVSVAALTIYDMCKAVDRGMTINAVKLMYKSGGKSGVYDRNSLNV
jgi:cyclic pyranopterin phosphate synthase